jgi:ATP-dependent Clp protease ATP-binding subunit ClpA
MLEKFTDRARKSMVLANQEAQRFNHEYIGTEHILLGLVKEGGGVAANVMKNLDVDLRKVRLEVEKLVKSGPDMVAMGKLPMTPRGYKVLDFANEESFNFNHGYVGTEHLLLGLIREVDGVAAQILMNLGLKLDKVREEVQTLLGLEREYDKDPVKQLSKRYIIKERTEEIRPGWEYAIKTESKTENQGLIVESLNLFGELGWEVIHVSETEDEYTFFLIRPKCSENG